MGNNGLADAHGAAVHGQDERARALRVFPQVEFGRLDGPARPGQLRQLSPCPVYIAVVADGAAQVGRRAGHEEGCGRGAVSVALLVLGEEFQSDTGIEEEAGAARIKPTGFCHGSGIGFAQSGQFVEESEIRSGEKDARFVESARHLDEARRVHFFLFFQ